MVAYTTTYSFAKPTVGDDEDVWGGYLNGNFDSIEALLNGTTALTTIDVTGNITVGGTVDGVDIAARDLVLTSTTSTANAALPKAGGTMTGAITFVAGQTFDGRDVSADGAKLDGIEAGATADQTKADIDALGIAASTAATLATARSISLAGDVSGSASFDGSANISITATVADDSHNHIISNVDGLQTALDGKLSTSGKAADSNLLDGIDSSAFLRSNAADSASGKITLAASGFAEQLEVNRSEGAFYSVIKYSNSVGELGKLGFDQNSNLLARLGTSGTDSYIWHSNNDGSGSGLDADLWDGNQFSSYLNQAVLTSSSPTFSNMYVGDNIYHNGDTDTRILFGTNTITMQTGGSSEITVNTTGVRLGDSGNGYFQPVSGNYGSVQIDGGAHGGWEGYSIGGRAVFMHDNSNTLGLYDDVNNHWALKHTLNGTTELHYNGSAKLDTLSNGVSINGNLYTDGSNAEDWDALSGTSVTCNVDNAGAFSLTMTGNTTFTFSGADNNWSQGFILQLTGNGGTVTWPASVDWAGGTAPDAPASGETDIYVFWTRDGGTTWYGVQSIDAAA